MHSASDHGYTAPSFCVRCGSPTCEPCGCEVVLETGRDPFNVAAYRHLVGLGYQYVQREASWEDDGDAESGPSLSGGPAYDEFVGEDERVIVTEDGYVDHEPRDLAFEHWEAAQSEPDPSPEYTDDGPQL